MSFSLGLKKRGSQEGGEIKKRNNEVLDEPHGGEKKKGSIGNKNRTRKTRAVEPGVSTMKKGDSPIKVGSTLSRFFRKAERGLQLYGERRRDTRALNPNHKRKRFERGK